MTETVFAQFSIQVGQYLLYQSNLDDREPLAYFLRFLNKETLVRFAKEKLAISKIFKKTKKDEIIKIIIDGSNREQLWQLFEKHAVTFGLHPTQLEAILNCTKTERKRWTEADWLPVLCYKRFQYGLYPVYDWIATIALINQVETWRESDRKQQYGRRKQAAQIANQTRQKRKQKYQEIVSCLESARENWKELADVFELAYWTVVADQLSQSYQDKVKRAKTKGQDYQAVVDELEALKSSAIALLIGSPSVSLHFHFTEDYPPDVVWHQKGWSAYFEAEKGNDHYQGFYVCHLNLSQISERALFVIPSHHQKRYNLPLPEDILPIEMASPQPQFKFWWHDKLIKEGELLTPKQIKTPMNRCLASPTLQQLTETREQKLSALAEAAKRDRAEMVEQQKQTVYLFREQFKNRFQTRKAHWLKHFPQWCYYFELAEFTRWASRAAKSLKQHQLSERSQRFYDLKNCAIAILNSCPIAKLTFYRPDKPDYGYVDPDQDHFVPQIEDYYSLFSTEIIVPNSSEPEDCFQFHTPYRIGKTMFPPIGDMEHVNHIEQQGQFRFGHPLNNLEQLIFTPEQIEEKLLGLINQFNSEEITKRRQQRFKQIAKETHEKHQRIKALEQMEVFLVEGNETEIIRYLYNRAIRQGLTRKKALNWIRNQLKSRATCSQNLQQYPEFSNYYFNKACQRKWGNSKLKQKLFQLGIESRKNNNSKLAY